MSTQYENEIKASLITKNFVKNIMEDPGFDKSMCSYESLTGEQIKRFADLFVEWLKRVDYTFACQYGLRRLKMKGISLCDDDGETIDVSKQIFVSSTWPDYNDMKYNEGAIDFKLTELIKRFSSSKINRDFIVHNMGKLYGGYITARFNELINYKADESLTLTETYPNIKIDDSVTIGELYNIFMTNTDKIPDLNLTTEDIRNLYSRIFCRIFNMPSDYMIAGFALFTSPAGTPIETLASYGACSFWAKTISAIGAENAMSLHRAMFTDNNSERLYMIRQVSKKNIR